MPGTFNNLPIDAFEMENHRPYRADLLSNLRRLNIETLNSIINTYILFFVTKFYFINKETIFFINLILINAVLSSNLRFKIKNLIVINEI